MLKIAITGNIASGKSTVEKILSDMGFAVMDTDIVAHDLLNCDEIKSIFKDFDIFENNEISRKKLGEIVFNNKDLLNKLENIIYPKVRLEIEKFFEFNSDKKYVFVSIPQLFESNMNEIFDKIVCICAEDDLRLKRLIKRNNYELSYAQKRMNAQMSQEEKIKHSDFAIDNNGTYDDLKIAITNLLKQLNSIK